MQLVRCVVLVYCFLSTLCVCAVEPPRDYLSMSDTAFEQWKKNNTYASAKDKAAWVTNQTALFDQLRTQVTQSLSFPDTHDQELLAAQKKVARYKAFLTFWDAQTQATGFKTKLQTALRLADRPLADKKQKMRALFITKAKKIAEEMDLIIDVRTADTLDFTPQTYAEFEQDIGMLQQDIDHYKTEMAIVESLYTIVANDHLPPVFHYTQSLEMLKKKLVAAQEHMRQKELHRQQEAARAAEAEKAKIAQKKADEEAQHRAAHAAAKKALLAQIDQLKTMHMTTEAEVSAFQKKLSGIYDAHEAYEHEYGAAAAVDNDIVDGIEHLSTLYDKAEEALKLKKFVEQREAEKAKQETEQAERVKRQEQEAREIAARKHAEKTQVTQQAEALATDLSNAWHAVDILTKQDFMSPEKVQELHTKIAHFEEVLHKAESFCVGRVGSGLCK